MNEGIAKTVIDVDLLAAKFGGSVKRSHTAADGAEEVEYLFRSVVSKRRFNEAITALIKENEREAS